MRSLGLAELDYDRLPALAADLVRDGTDDRHANPWRKGDEPGSLPSSWGASAQLRGGIVEVERTKHLYQADEFFGLGIKGVANEDYPGTSPSLSRHARRTTVCR